MQLVFITRFNALPETAPDELRYPHVRLFRNTWNDYGFKTLFSAVIHLSPEEDDWAALGGVKIGFLGQKTTDPPMRTVLKGVLPGLPETHFSLGQDPNYYDVLQRLDGDVRRAYAESLRDVPMLRLPNARLEEEEQVFRISLLRSSRALEALDHATALYGQQADLVDRFTFQTRITALGDHVVPFNFEPRNGLPHRVNVLVGVNGVGKTQLMAHLAVALSRFEAKETQRAREEAGETFEAIGTLAPRPSFYGVVAVPPSLHHEVQHLAFVIDRSPEVHPPAADGADHLVQVPTRSRAGASLLQSLRDQRPELDRPAADGLVRHVFTLTAPPRRPSYISRRGWGSPFGHEKAQPVRTALHAQRRNGAMGRRLDRRHLRGVKSILDGADHLPNDKLTVTQL
jgi:hypothetical protein